MSRHQVRSTVVSALAITFSCFVSIAQDPPEEQEAGESERSVTEGEVPKAALDALKRVAGGSKITEFAEEMEHGHTFYEGSWAGPNGHVDVLVTATGDLVEIEESVPATSVPAAVRAESEKASRDGTELTFEKKTIVMYEIHFKRAGKVEEAIFTADARRYNERSASGADDEDEDEDDDHDGDDDDRQ